MQIDDIDRRLLRLFQADPTLTAAELAEAARLPRATAWRRIERMEEAGIIRSLEAVIDWRKLGFAVEVSLRITLDKTERGVMFGVNLIPRRLGEIALGQPVEVLSTTSD